MTQQEIEIQSLEKQIQTILDTVALMGGVMTPAVQEKIDSINAEIKNKKAELDSQKKESVYEHLARIVGYSPELKQCIESTVDQLLVNDVSNASDPGLLLGKIQCGKTRAFVGCMGLAFDRGIDICIVLTKSDNGLVGQTVARMKYEFRDYIGNTDMDKCCSIDVHLIERELSFSDAQINNQKNIFVIYKNVARLNMLISLFKDPRFSSKRVLIIDDEADFVSRAFYQRNEEIEVGKVASLIDKFARMPEFCRYLQVTATPYSLFLQPDHTVEVSNGTVEPFRPRFTTLVPIHENYVGGKQYFVLSQNNQSMYSYLKHIVRDICMEHLLYKNRDKRVYENAAKTQVYHDLRVALMSYFAASAIRQIQEETLNKRRYFSSFFMHISTSRADHKFEKTVVNNILTSWKDNISSGEDSDMKRYYSLVYCDFKISNEAARNNGELDIFMPDPEEVWERIKGFLTKGEYIVQIVNSTVSDRLLGDDGQLRLTCPLNIFIGGFKLDRGITIDHMLGFMYGRNPQIHQTDSVLQHHRMYGNRSKADMAVTRLHTTRSLYDIMSWIDNMDHQLREVFVEAMRNPTAPVPLVTIQYNRQLGVVPCGANRLLISDLESFDSFKRFTTAGFQTGCATAIKPIIDGITTMLENEPEFKIGEPFLISKDHATHILKNIRSTFIYNRPIDNNRGLEWNEDIMIAAIEKYTPEDGMIWCYMVQNRNMSRLRKDGGFVDAPEDGKTDTPIARKFTQGESARPFLMLLKENGLQEAGWRGAPFFWPCLRLPQNIKSCVFCKN